MSKQDAGSAQRPPSGGRPTPRHLVPGRDADTDADEGSEQPVTADRLTSTRGSDTAAARACGVQYGSRAGMLTEPGGQYGELTDESIRVGHWVRKVSTLDMCSRHVQESITLIGSAPDCGGAGLADRPFGRTRRTDGLGRRSDRGPAGGGQTQRQCQTVPGTVSPVDDRTSLVRGWVAAAALPATSNGPPHTPKQ